MIFEKVKSYAKINLALNITGKTLFLHKIESITAFALLHDVIFIKRIKSNKHNISFSGKFSNKIGDKNTVSKLLEILDKKKILKNKKFRIKINKNIPFKAGLGGGSMNAANILKYFIEKKVAKIKKKDIPKICKLVGSDVILGLNSSNSILTSKNQIKYFNNSKKYHILMVKPDFGCSTKKIFSKVRKFNKPYLNQPNKRMFDINFLKKLGNSLEAIAFNKYPKLEKIKLYLENITDPIFVRMSGSGSVLVGYYQSKKRCENAKKKFKRKYKNYWCITSKTI